ncbi:hypothetical protein CHS0354_042570 [Potamilus streckersoni]|uniref:Uncharacterized protein n=1 Tax=Potamilus streckersoni TaxID=2493646 RepID=A0AAE0WBJ9_9BIVA|nr:hypothetical protein CHS0354_042570 [Potamilus streckersoni]
MVHRTLRLWLFLFLSMVYIIPIKAQTSDDARDLYNKIFITDAYNKHIRPIYDQTREIDVAIDFYLTGIIDFDERQEKLTTSGYLLIRWDDYYLQWNQSTYNNLSSIFIPQDNVWKPDVALKNSFAEYKGLGSSFLYVFVDNRGSVLWQPYVILQSTCNVDITYIPFDTQNCSLNFVAWSYTKDQVLLLEGKKGIILNEYEMNSAWTIVSSSADTKSESSEATVIFQFSLRRKPLFYVLYIIMPVVMLSVLNVCIFVLPSESGEKASFSVTAFLSMAVFLTMVTSAFPQSSDKVSYLGIYLETMITFSTLIVIITLFELRLNFRDESVDPIPSWLITLHLIVKTIKYSRRNTVKSSVHNKNLAVLSRADSKNINESRTERVHSEELLNSGNKEHEVTWKNVCNAVDFAFFWIFLSFIFITTVTLFCISSSGPS